MAWTPELEAEYQALEAQYGNQPAVPPAITSNPGANQKLLEAQAGAIGKAQAEEALAAPKKAAEKEAQAVNDAELLQLIDDAIKQSGWWSTGLGAETLAGYGGTDAANLEAKLTPIRSSIALNRMKDLKEASPTGSTGFGAMSEKELALLTGEQGALSLGQSAQQLDDTLRRVRRMVVNRMGGESDWTQTPSGSKYRVIK